MGKIADLYSVVDECLQAMASGASLDDCLLRYAQYHDDLEPLLRAAEALRSLPKVEPRAAFAQASQRRLKERIRLEPSRRRSWRLADRFGLGASSRWTRLSPPYPLSALVVGLLLGVALSGGGGMVFASQRALPGQPLYAVKLMAESARLGVTAGDARQSQVRLDMAEERLIEVATLVAEGDDRWAPVALERYWQEVSEAVTAVEGLQAGLPPEASDEFSQRLFLQVVTLGDIERRLAAQGETSVYSEAEREQALEAVRAVLKDTQALLPPTEPDEGVPAPTVEPAE